MHLAHNYNTTTREGLRLDLLKKISTSSRVILEINDTSKSLQIWPWCVSIFATAGRALSILLKGLSMTKESE